MSLFKFDLANNTAADPGYAVHDDKLPYIPWGDKAKLKLLAADVEGSRFVVRLQFEPGIQFPPHMHTGAVHAFTHAGNWTYLEYGDATSCTAGSYLYEPAGSVHTLFIPETNTGITDVSFIVEGAMIHLNPDGSVMAIGDAESHIREYAEGCRKAGFEVPDIVIGGRTRIQPVQLPS